MAEMHRCAHPRCPGYAFKASELAHPAVTCGANAPGADGEAAQQTPAGAPPVATREVVIDDAHAVAERRADDTGGPASLGQEPAASTAAADALTFDEPWPGNPDIAAEDIEVEIMAIEPGAHAPEPFAGTNWDLCEHGHTRGTCTVCRMRAPIEPGAPAPEQCDQCGAHREDWQPPQETRCPNHANPNRSCDGTLRSPAPEPVCRPAGAGEPLRELTVRFTGRLDADDFEAAASLLEELAGMARVGGDDDDRMYCQTQDIFGALYRALRAPAAQPAAEVPYADRLASGVARRLERERDEARAAARSDYNDVLAERDAMQLIATQVGRERDEARAELAALDDTSYATSEVLRIAERERDEARAEMARLQAHVVESERGWFTVAAALVETYAIGPGNLPGCVQQLAERHVAARAELAALTSDLLQMTRAEAKAAEERDEARAELQALRAAARRFVKACDAFEDLGMVDDLHKVQEASAARDALRSLLGEPTKETP